MIRILALLLSLFWIAEAKAGQVFQVILEPYLRTEVFAEIVAVYAEVAGLVVEIPKKMGDPVEKGDLLIRMENAHFRADYNKAKVAVERGEEDIRVKRELYKEHLLSKLELLESETVLANALAELALAERNLSSSEIHAGYKGKISNVYVHIYDLPSREKPMLEYVNDEILVAKFLIPSYLLKEIHVGSPVYILIKDTDSVISTTINRIGPTINPASGTVKVEAEIDNSQGSWISGMTSFASFDRSALFPQTIEGQ